MDAVSPYNDRIINKVKVFKKIGCKLKCGGLNRGDEIKFMKAECTE